MFSQMVNILQFKRPVTGSIATKYQKIQYFTCHRKFELELKI